MNLFSWSTLALLAPALACAQEPAQVASDVNTDPNFEARYCSFLSASRFEDNVANYRWYKIIVTLEEGRSSALLSDISRDAFALAQQAGSAKAKEDFERCNARLAVIEAQAQQAQVAAASAPASSGAVPPMPALPPGGSTAPPLIKPQNRLVLGADGQTLERAAPPVASAQGSRFRINNGLVQEPPQGRTNAAGSGRQAGTASRRETQGPRPIDHSGDPYLEARYCQNIAARFRNESAERRWSDIARQRVTGRPKDAARPEDVDHIAGVSAGLRRDDEARADEAHCASLLEKTPSSGASDHTSEPAAGSYRKLPTAPRDLAAYGFEYGIEILDDTQATYYLTEYRQFDNPVPPKVAVVALVKGGKDAGFVEAETVSGVTDGGMKRRLAASEIERFNTVIAPAITRTRLPLARLEEFTSFYYLRGQHFSPTESFEYRYRMRKPAYEQPLLELLWQRADPDARFQPHAAIQNGVSAAALPVTVAEATRERAADTAVRPAPRATVQAERSPHYVYKSNYFWASLPNFYIPQQVFNGDFGSFQINTQFPEHFIRFVSAYSAHCEAQIKQGPYQKRTLQTLNAHGNVQSERHLYVEARFVPVFEAYEKRVGFSTAGEITGILLNRQGDLASAGAGLLSSPVQFINDLMNYRPQGAGNSAMNLMSRHLGGNDAWQRFFGEGDRLCSGATVTQMRENMLRAATGQPSLQQSGVRVPNAASETEPSVPPPGKETIFDGCYQNHDYKDADFCMCMDTRAGSVMRPEERKKYAADFSLYYSEIVFPQKGGPEDPRWRLYDLLKECKR